MIVEVPLGARTYPIHIAPGLLSNAAPLLGRLAPRGRLAVVTDTNVASLYLPDFTAGRSQHPALSPRGGVLSFAGVEV